MFLPHEKHLCYQILLYCIVHSHRVIFIPISYIARIFDACTVNFGTVVTNENRFESCEDSDDKLHGWESNGGEETCLMVITDAIILITLVLVPKTLALENPVPETLV
jgi:hypothetical protein